LGSFEINVKLGGEETPIINNNDARYLSNFNAFLMALVSSGLSECEGEWKGKSAGGCVNFPTWRNGPQFQLTPKFITNVHVLLELHVDPQEQIHYPHIGFYVVKSTDPNFKRVLLNPKDIVTECKFANKLSISAKATLNPEEGPYVIIPSTFDPGVEGKFSVVVSGKGINLSTLSDTMWHSVTTRGEWKGKSAGGCKNYDSWTNNPQFILTISTKSTISIVLIQSKKTNFHGIGVYVRDESTKRIIGKSKFVSALEASSVIELPSEGNFCLIPTTFNPGIEDKFALIVFCKEQFTIGTI